MKYFKPAAILLAVSLIGYFSYKLLTKIPENNVEDAKVFIQALDRQKKSLGNEKNKFDAVTKSDDWVFLAPYAEAGEWIEKFTAAQSDISSAENLKNDVIDRIIERDHKDDVAELVAAISKGVALIRSSKLAATYPMQRAERILEAKANKKAYFENATTLMAASNKASDTFKIIVDNSLAVHAAKNEDIKEKMKKLSDIIAGRNGYFSAMQSEYRATSINYAKYIDSYDGLKKANQESVDFVDKNTALLAQLDRNYVKILTDQQVDYYVVVGRANWCEGEYCSEGSELRYPAAQVDEDTFEFFENSNVSAIARNSIRFGGSSKFSLLIPQQRWDALGIDYQYRWNRREPYAEYWVDTTATKTFHKYTIIEDGEVKEQDWVSVSDALFWKHYENLGMAIETKPFGFYESELIDAAEPVGMAAIAIPTMVDGVPTGSNQYGEWRQSGGSSFFHYYGMYSLFSNFGYSRRYSYNDWNHYNSNGRSSAYYGRDKQHGTYGSATYTGSRYSNSAFARRNPSTLSGAKTNRSSRIGSSIRGAGPSGRGKGPSGSGK